VPFGGPNDRHRGQKFDLYNYPIKVCNICHTIYNRDDAAAENVFIKGEASLLGAPPPALYTRLAADGDGDGDGEVHDTDKWQED
jgi:hypothetical protein